ncbi:ABC transporter ATP-binding protein [Paenibacillus spongiae]|uniref:Dipeptide/oligopeptide/nickel ABC transporter ATP-binding protein n=1 Tax=Paenibacillus spongiae TaxID=2909671 RepID=A0ABY5S590_9BACL|nr:dipeptide/oligopeptide/nickel ABC transporter ATP-binding protein [Paenibacillus spongiae]UVI28032.1 dipeptide/oligopeptide/nickel ABC transporter ATP-binding protein [Paenibacillus spongiae]
MLSLNQVSKHYDNKKQRHGKPVRAVHEVTFELRPNEIFALIGESGSGKSTLAEMIVGLQKPTAGSISWSERPSSVQMVFQNPDRSMNPYWKIKDIIAEPLILSKHKKKAALEQASRLAEKVKLPRDILDRYPTECSGGQKQRIAIARALTMSPKLLVADEITSALDPSIEAEIMQLLLSLKHAEGMSILYITHRIETITSFADRVAVMRNGVIEALGMTNDVLLHSTSAYTQALMNACLYGDDKRGAGSLA